MRKKLLLLFLSLSGLSTPSSCLNSEYHFVPEMKTWTEAQQYCRNMGVDLATVGNTEDNDKLTAEMERHENEAATAWIGLHDDHSAWKWSLDNEDHNSETDYSNWASQEPNYYNAKENCTVIQRLGSWDDKGCDEEHASVCYDDEKIISKYIYVGDEMTWPAAQEYCRTTHTDLASVKNMIQNGIVSGLLSFADDAWIGLHRQPWARWSDQTATTFTNWGENQPDNFNNEQQCVLAIIATGKWYDKRCTEVHPFFCQNVTFPSTTELPSTTGPPSSSPAALRKTTFKLKIHTEADMSDPAVQHQVLQQLHAELEKKGLSDFKLRWVQRDGQIFHEEQERDD